MSNKTLFMVLMCSVFLFGIIGSVSAFGVGGTYEYDIRDDSGVLWRVHVFNSTGSHSLVLDSPVNEAEVLVVAGGGAGGAVNGNGVAGGGGAGGVIYETIQLPSGTIPVTVGAGGTGSTDNQANSGLNSTLGSLVAIGGGAGGRGNFASSVGGGYTGSNGGSGGGGGTLATSTGCGGGTGVVGQGNNGGTRGGGGGGFSGAGTSPTGSCSGTSGVGDGGAGLTTNILVTTSLSVAGGGGGGGGVASHGGGAGGSNSVGGDAQDGTGGGGGGARDTSTTRAGGSGGDGIVIVRYKLEELTIIANDVYDSYSIQDFSANITPSYSLTRDLAAFYPLGRESNLSTGGVLDLRSGLDGTASGYVVNDGVVSGGVSINETTGAIDFPSGTNARIIVDDNAVLSGFSEAAWMFKIERHANSLTNAGGWSKYLGTGDQRSWMFRFASGSGVTNRLQLYISEDGTNDAGKIFTRAGANSIAGSVVPIGETGTYTILFKGGEYIRVYLDDVLIGNYTEDIPLVAFANDRDMTIGWNEQDGNYGRENYFFARMWTGTGTSEWTIEQIEAEIDSDYAVRGSGLVFQASGRDFLGTPEAPTTILDTNYLVSTGVTNAPVGWRFGGSNSINLPSDFFPFANENKQSISFWFKLDVKITGGTTLLFSSAGGSNNRVYVQKQPSGNIQTRIGTTTFNLLFPEDYETNEWFHIAFTRDASNNRHSAWINGELLVDNESITIGTATTQAQTFIGSLFGTGNYFRGAISSPKIINRLVSQEEVLALYNEGASAEYPFSLPSETVTTTNGTINYFLPTGYNKTVNISLFDIQDRGGYFNQELFNIESNVVALLHQSIASFEVRNIVTGELITNYTASTTDHGGSATNTSENPTLSLPANEFNVTINKTGWYDRTIEVTTTPQTTTHTETTLYNHIANISLSVTGGADPNNFTIIVRDDEGHGFEETISTTNGSIQAQLVHGTYTLELDHPSFARTNKTITLNSSQDWTNITIQAFTTNTVNLEFRNEINNQIINDREIEIFITGELESYTGTTTNGTIIFEMIQPQSYVITYNAENYTQRRYAFTLTDREVQEITLYLIKEDIANIVLVSVRDGFLTPIEGSTVRAQRKNLAGTNYFTVETCTTDNLGECLLRLELFDTTYRFLIEQNQELIFTSIDQEIKGTSISFLVDLLAGTRAQLIDGYLVQGQITFNNDTFSFAYNHVEGTNIQACMRVNLRNRGVNTLISQDCVSNTASGVITSTVDMNTSGEYTAIGYVLNSPGNTIASLSISTPFTIGSQLGLMGLLLFGFFIIGVTAFTGLFNPAVPPIIVIGMLWLLSYLQFISVGVGVIGTLAVGAVIVIFMTRN